MIHVVHPFRSDRDLGRAYNEAVYLIGEDDHICLMDTDAMLLTPDAITHLEIYAEMFPKSLLTCYTNRLHVLGTSQLLGGVINDDDRMSTHIRIAEKQKEHLYRTTQLNNVISGFMMMISKKLWWEIPFPETGQCLGVDNYFSQAVLYHPDYDIRRMEGIYCWHSYRLVSGLRFLDHLTPPDKKLKV